MSRWSWHHGSRGRPPQGNRGFNFPETGHTVALDFAQFWLDNGGQHLFGLPISRQSTLRTASASSGSSAPRFERWPGQRVKSCCPLLADEYLEVTGTIAGHSAEFQP